MSDKAPDAPQSKPAAPTPAPPAVPGQAAPTSGAAPTGGAQPAGAKPPTAAPRPAAAPPAPKPKSSAAAGFAIFLALVALLVAVAAGGLAAYALKEARDAKQSAPAPLGTATAAATTEPPATTSPESSPSAAPSTSTRPPVTYVQDLDRISVRIPGPSGCNASYVDVDTIANTASTGHEFYLSTCLDAAKPELRVDRTSGRSTSGPNPTPETCAALVSGTTGTTELVLQAQPGLSFCLLTNLTDAHQQTLPQRLAAVEVLSINSVDHSVTVAISTWHMG